MATVELNQLWLHDAADLDTYLRFNTTARSDERAVPGEVRSYAAGRRRSITRAGRRQAIPVTLRLVTDANLAALDAWQGALLMLRDHRGRLLFGSYFSIGVQDYKDRSGYDVTLSFADVTHTVEV